MEEKRTEECVCTGSPSQVSLALTSTVTPPMAWHRSTHPSLSSTPDRESAVLTLWFKHEQKNIVSSSQHRKSGWNFPKKRDWRQKDVSKENTKFVKYNLANKAQISNPKYLNRARLSALVSTPSQRVLCRDMLTQIIHKPSLHIFLCLHAFLGKGLNDVLTEQWVMHAGIKKCHIVLAFESDRSEWLLWELLFSEPLFSLTYIASIW